MRNKGEIVFGLFFLPPLRTLLALCILRIVSDDAPNTQLPSRAIAAHTPKRTRRGASATVPMSMAMTMIASMGPRFPVLLPAVPIIFQLRSRVSLPLRLIFTPSQRWQLQSRPDVPARRCRVTDARGTRASNRGSRSRRWGDSAVFPRRRRSSFPSATVLALALLLLLPGVHSRRWRWCRCIAWRAPPVLVRRGWWCVLIRVVCRR